MDALPATGAPRAEPWVLAAFAGIVLIGGVNFVAVRFSNLALPPFGGAALRFGLAALVLLAWVALRRTPLPGGPALRGALVYGSLGFGASYALAYWALVEAPAALAAVAAALVPLLTLLLAAGVGLEKVTARALGGGVLAALGIAILFLEHLGGPVPLASLLALLAMAATIAASSVAAKRSPRGDPFAFNGVAMAAGTLLLGAAALAAGEPWVLPRPGPAMAAVAYLVLVGSIALFGLYLYVLQRWTASATAYQFVLMPLVTIVAGALLAGEAVTPLLLVAAVLVGLGVWAGALRKPPSRVARPALPSAHAVVQD
jgi:drug/metabolite transporter (DMT)-like permease